MATATMYPDGDGTVTGSVGGTPSTPPYYTLVDEGTVSPDDADTILMSSTPASIFLTLTSTPADCATVTDVLIKIRTVDASKGRTIASCQIFENDESTAITALANISGSTTATTYTLNPSITGATSKSAWDGARIKINSGGSSGIAVVYALQIDITYSTGGGGGGGGGPNRIFSWLFPGKAVTNFNGALVVPHDFPAT